GGPSWRVLAAAPELTQRRCELGPRHAKTGIRRVERDPERFRHLGSRLPVDLHGDEQSAAIQGQALQCVQDDRAQLGLISRGVGERGRIRRVGRQPGNLAAAVGELPIVRGHPRRERQEPGADGARRIAPVPSLVNAKKQLVHLVVEVGLAYPEAAERVPYVIELRLEDAAELGVHAVLASVFIGDFARVFARDLASRRPTGALHRACLDVREGIRHGNRPCRVAPPRALTSGALHRTWPSSSMLVGSRRTSTSAWTPSARFARSGKSSPARAPVLHTKAASLRGRSTPSPETVSRSAANWAHTIAGPGCPQVRAAAPTSVDEMRPAGELP